MHHHTKLLVMVLFLAECDLCGLKHAYLRTVCKLRSRVRVKRQAPLLGSRATFAAELRCPRALGSRRPARVGGFRVSRGGVRPGALPTQPFPRGLCPARLLLSASTRTICVVLCTLWVRLCIWAGAGSPGLSLPSVGFSQRCREPGLPISLKNVILYLFDL